MSEAMVLCPCGARHPEGFACEAGERIRRQRAAEHAHHHKHEHETGHCHAPADPHPHEHSCCCGHSGTLQAAGSGTGSGQTVVYRIDAMDCPMEEALIRKKLERLPGVVSLEFRLVQRLLSVRHTLDSTADIEAALQAIDMPPAFAGVEAVFVISGMDCPVEEGLVRSRLADMDGVYGLDFNLMQRRLVVRHEAAQLANIVRALESLNMGALLVDQAKPEARTAPESSRTPWRRLAVAGVFAALAEAIEVVLQWQAPALEAALNRLPSLGAALDRVSALSLVHALPLLAALIAIGLSGLGTYRKGWIAVTNGNLNINALMSVAVTGALCIGQYPEAAMVMVLFNLSEAIEALSLARARQAIGKLLALAPERATVLDASGNWTEVDIQQVAVGTRVRVRPGEKVGLDGVVASGMSTVNQAPITGESMPVEKRSGDPVFAGSINESGSFEFTVSAPATDSTLARIIRAVEEAQASRAPMQRFVDVFARYYTPAVFLLAILIATAGPLAFAMPWKNAVYTALVVLVIGCPCALVISIPVSIVSGLAAATRHGILIKGGMFLESGRKLGWLALDKTGTITRGRPVQTDFFCMSGDADRAWRLAASLASRSDHPVSKALVEAAGDAPLLPVEDFAALPGQGVAGRMDGQLWHLGNHRMVEDLGRCSEALEARIFPLEEAGKTVVALVGEQGAVALFAVADTVRASSREAIGELRQLGIKTLMLTGDNAHTAAAIAKEVGVDEFKADMLPEDKLEAVAGLAQQAKGRVGMVGDGINDAPALARADIGFAMAAGGTDVAIETADVALMDDDLRKIPRFIRLSRATCAILMQNIVLALGVKALFFALAFAGMATMWMAVFADVGTALLVVANGLRAMRL